MSVGGPRKNKVLADIKQTVY